MSLKLPRLILGVPLVNPQTGSPTPTFVTWWEQVAKALETQETTQDAQLAAILAAQATANEALETAEDALAGGGQMNAATSLKLSYPAGVVITGLDNGADTGVTISAHERRYGNGDTVTVNAGALTPFAYGTEVIIFYDDATRAGGAVFYEYTAVLADARSSDANPNRHYVGYVTTPALAGDPPTDGVAAEVS